MPPETAPPATLAPMPGLWPDARAARRPLLLRLPRLPPGAAAGRPRSDWSAARLLRPPRARTAPGASPRSTVASPPADVPGPWPLPAHPFERAASFSASLAPTLVPVYLRSLLTGVTPWLGVTLRPGLVCFAQLVLGVVAQSRRRLRQAADVRLETLEQL